MAFLYLAITGSLRTITSVVMEMRMLWLTLIHIWLLFTYMNDFLQDGLMELHIVPVNMRCRVTLTVRGSSWQNTTSVCRLFFRGQWNQTLVVMLSQRTSKLNLKTRRTTKSTREKCRLNAVQSWWLWEWRTTWTNYGFQITQCYLWLTPTSIFQPFLNGFPMSSWWSELRNCTWRGVKPEIRTKQANGATVGKDVVCK